jgi:GNAT superfamily N-acetyltransferase
LTPALHIRHATLKDVPELVSVINKAYEVEHYIKEGDRTDAEGIQERLSKGTFIIAEVNDKIAASIYVELRNERAYFGMLAVHPEHQGAKLGFKLIGEAEDFARKNGCRHMDIQILSVRKELPPFYRMIGYSENGTSELPAEIELKIPCHFINMTKEL